MPWNEPGGGNDGNKPDPWNRRRPQQNPDLDETLRQLSRKLGGIFGGGGNGNRSGSGGNAMAGGVLFAGIGGIVLAAWVLFGFYTVNEKERAIVLRFGEYESTEGPGLHWAPPMIDRVEVLDTQSVNQEQIRGRMLTEDEFLVEVTLSVQYRIEDPVAFLFNMTDPQATLVQAAESALRTVVGRSQLDEILTSGGAVQVQAGEELKRIMDTYNAGIAIADVNLQERKAPDAVREAFDDAIKAREDKERTVKIAETYASKEIPLAQARAQQILQDAEAYRTQVIAQASGEVQRFQKLLPQYLVAPEVTRQRLYLETMEAIMGRVSKVVVDVEKGNNMLYLPLDRMAPGRAQAGAAAEAQNMSGGK